MGRPTKAQAEAWTQALLDVARALFCEKGYAGASLDELASRLSCSKHSIYRRFADKEALFCRVIERDVARFVSTLETSRTADPKASPRKAMRAMARAYFGYGASREYAALYAALTLETTKSAALRTKAAEWAGAALAPLQTAVEQAVPGADAVLLCDLVIDLLDGAANRLRLHEVERSQLDEAFLARWSVIERVLFPEPAAN